jgi:hypothetical protein
MFKKLVPVIALALIAGPAFAADTTPASGQTTTTPKSHHKHHSSTSKNKAPKPAGGDTSNAPAK